MDRFKKIAGRNHMLHVSTRVTPSRNKARGPSRATRAWTKVLTKRGIRVDARLAMKEAEDSKPVHCIYCGQDTLSNERFCNVFCRKGYDSLFEYECPRSMFDDELVPFSFASNLMEDDCEDVGETEPSSIRWG